MNCGYIQLQNYKLFQIDDADCAPFKIGKIVAHVTIPDHVGNEIRSTECK